MCGLCGMLGGPVHWADADPVGDAAQAADSPDAAGLDHASDSSRAADANRRRRQDRQRRVAGLNRVLRAYACTVSDWQGHAYLLGTFTGKSEIVADLAALWPALQRLTGRSADPFDTALLERLRESP